MKDMVFYTKCPNCKKDLMINLSSFMQDSGLLLDAETKRVQRRCLNCGETIVFSFKYTCFVAHLKPENAEVLFEKMQHNTLSKAKKKQYKAIKKE